MKNLNRKGFTLIELLAVIVVLAIILVIAVPRVMAVIETARKESLGKSAQIAAKQLQQDYAVSVLGTPDTAKTTATACPASVKFTEGTCTYTSILTNSEMTFAVTIVGSGKFAGWTADSADGATAVIIATVTP